MAEMLDCCFGGGASVRDFHADDTLSISAGDVIDWTVAALDICGGAVALGGAEVAVFDASTPALMAAEITMPDEEAGLIRILVPSDGLKIGRLNWLRLRLTWPLFSDVPGLVSSRLWIALS